MAKIVTGILYMPYYQKEAVNVHAHQHWTKRPKAAI